jgi:uncharacterized damage-inducible protein DinB
MVSELEPIWQQFIETYDALRQALSEVPDDRLTWRPGPNANSVAGIVQHVAGSNLLYARMMASGDYGPRREPEENRDRGHLSERLQESEQIVRETFERMTPEALPQPRADRWNPLGPEVEGPFNAHWFALQIVRHSAYHLVQLNVYLLLMEGNSSV